jgi:diguanylate cyclase (GGDEF)-like protein
VLLDDRMSQAIMHARRAGEGFAVCVLDLDRFKPINDSLGHRAGDELLKHVARRLTSAVRSVDTVARLGGDEFVLIISQARTKADTERVARNVLEALQAPIKIGEDDVHTSASIGIAFYPGDGTTIETLYAHADAAMYCAKQRGGLNVEFFAPSMNLATEDRVRFEADLHRALKQQQFELHYQPKFNATTRRIHSAEALIRWRHPERGLIPPDQFIPLAEESDRSCRLASGYCAKPVGRRGPQDQGLPSLRRRQHLGCAVSPARSGRHGAPCADGCRIDAQY